MKRSIRWIVSVLGLILVVLPATTAAQSIWIGQSESNYIALEWLRAEFDEAEDLAFLSSAMLLSARGEVATNVRLVGELPFAYASFEGEDANSGIGNPYLGMEVGDLDGLFWGEVGVRAPLASEDDEAMAIGFLTDYDRCEAFMPDVLSIIGAGNLQFKDRSGFSARLRAGPLLEVYTGNENFGDDTELFAIYSLQGWYNTEQVRFGAGLTGRMLATEDGLDLGERSIHHLGLALVGTFRSVHPGLHFRLPLDEDFNDFLNYVVGVNVTVPFGHR